MLQFILGTAGTGKTTRLMARMKAAAKKKKEIILLVPEQYSFEAERLLHRTLGPEMALGVEVLSFTRLCNLIFRRYGGLAGVPVSEAGKYLLMSVALGELRDSLRFYRKSASNVSFLQTLVSTCGEFKTAGITPDTLREVSRRCDEPVLQDKLNELVLIYSAWQGLLDTGYTDPEDDLIRAERLLRENCFFEGIHIFVDGFTTFMSAEFALLGHVLAQAEEVSFAMTADSLHDEQKGTGVFSPVKSAAARLIRLARENGVSVGVPEVLTEPFRYTHPALAHLSEQFLQPVPDVFLEDTGDAIHIFEAADIYREAEYIAAQIALLVKDMGYRYRDIAVVARDTEPYDRAIRTMFARYDIPWFSDAREEVENFPLVGGILSALDAVRFHFDGASVLACAKSPLTGQPVESVALLENYCYCWGVRGQVWNAPFTNNPRGLSEQLTEEDIHTLEEINQVRDSVMAPLNRLRKALQQTSGRSFARGIYRYLEETQAAHHLMTCAQQMEQGERETFLDQSAQLWDVLMDILDVFGSVLGNTSISISQACELFRLAAGTVEIAQVPQTLDQVLVGAADRIRPSAVKAVFVIGSGEGIFPRNVGMRGLFSDVERQRLHELGAGVSPPALQQSILERYFLYFAVTLPEDRLYLSCSRSGATGSTQQPSVAFSVLNRMFPRIISDKLSAFTLVFGPKSALELLARNGRADNPQTAALTTFLQDTPIVERIHRASNKTPHMLTDANTARELLGTRVRLSPSKVERYYQCPFAWFASDGLSLKKRKKVEFTPLESGTVIHNVLQVMVQRHGGRGLAALTESQMSAEIREIIQEYLQQRIENMENLPARFRYLFTRLTGMLSRLLFRLGREFIQSEFDPLAFELPISHKEGIPPLELTTVDGVRVTVEGVIDRVDVMNKNGKRYIRVVDYKSGSRDFHLHEILYGLNMQMLLYLFTIQENGDGALVNSIPAGVLYMPVRESYLSTDRDTPAEELRRVQEKQWRMNGILIEDEEALRGMEQDLAGIFIPVKMGKNGRPDAASSLISQVEMGRLSMKIRQMITQMAESLGQGEISACPVHGGSHDVCQWCDFRSVCGFEPGDPVRTLAKIDRVQFFKLLEEEQNV